MSSKNDTSAWICSQLSKVLGIDTTEDVADYILSIEDPKELEDYLSDLLDPSIPSHKRFIKDLLRRWRPPPRQIGIPTEVQIYRKSDNDETYLSSLKESKSKKKNKKYAEENDNGTIPQPPPKDNVDSYDRKNVDTYNDKKKTKFVPLFSEEGEAKTVAHLPGRHPCECLATKHGLVNNCLSCGRIVCCQEGSGPCLFCGTLVCTNAEEEVLSRGSKKSEKLREQLCSGDNGKGMLPNRMAQIDKGMDSALSHKNKLLEYDRNSVKRTQVIDDESDYFATEWMSKSDRQRIEKKRAELHAQKHASRLSQKVTLDFAGRKVVQEDEVVDMFDIANSVLQDNHGNVASAAPVLTDEDSIVNPTITIEAPKFVGDMHWSKAVADSTAPKRRMVIQDRELQLMSDDGMCLSMHQPWASLLVKGIKKHEGRSWYTAHRGRLWIAATAKTPEQQEITSVEQFYRDYYKDKNLQFPTSYPVGCLLGCVDLVDCLDSDNYREQFPNGESESPYVFVCSGPHELLVKYPMKGKHKIYKLDANIHRGAKKGLVHVAEQ